MRRFAALYQALDASTATLDKVAAVVAYLAEADDDDAAWAVYFLAGGRPRQVVPTALLRQLACEAAGIDDWLFDACCQAVGDLAETIALVLPPPGRDSDESLAVWVEERLLPLRGLPPAEQAARLRDAFDRLDAAGRFLFLKLIGGGLRVGVGRLLVQRALAQHAGLDAKLMAQRLIGWTDQRARIGGAGYRALLAPPEAAVAGAPRDDGQPYPFFLAHALAGDPAPLGDVADWLVEWKYDGIRAQALRRAGRSWVWSRGEELVTDRFPEIAGAIDALPDGTVLDGEVLVWHAGSDTPASFQLLQQRIGRKTVTRKILAEAPVVYIAFDLLEAGGADLRALPQQARRQALEALLPAGPALRLSPIVEAADWAGLAARRAQSRQRGVEGLMLKHRQARYGSGRTKADGAWWKWKIEPLVVDCVLVYAQAGHGRRAGVHTDYTFAVWNRPPRDPAEAEAAAAAIARREPPAPGALQLVPFAKAYSGLSDAESAQVDREIRSHTVERFGPVRSVRPTLVFELGFEGIQRSSRHRSGIAVRFPRMLRIRRDKPLHEADALPTLEALIDAA